MMYQFIEGLPGTSTPGQGLVVPREAARFDAELYSFYQDYLDVVEGRKDLQHSRFRMSADTAETLSAFLDFFRRWNRPCRAVKGQIVGPFTLLTGLKDQRDRALLYDERWQDVVTRHLALKAKWQILQLQSLECPVILFIDEPALAGFGSSAFISVSEELIGSLLAEVVTAIHEAGAMAGIHICANTNWNLAFRSGVDIINFDSYNYFERFILYRDGLAAFLQNRGIVAWGVIPTNDPELIERVRAQDLAQRWLADLDSLAAFGLSRSELLAQSLITPSCGCGSLSEGWAERVVELCSEVSRLIRNAVSGG
jgi:hypothetical protein